MERSASVWSDRNVRDHLWRWSSLIGRTEICPSILTNRFIALLLFRRFHSCRELGKGIENSESYSSRLALFDLRTSFYFPRVVSLAGLA